MLYFKITITFILIVFSEKIKANEVCKEPCTLDGHLKQECKNSRKIILN